MASGKFAAARDILLGLAAARPDDLPSRRNLVAAHLRLGDYAAAEPLARDLAERAAGDDRAPALFFLAYALWGCGRTADCRMVVDSYVEALREAGPRPR
jgi:hypothetical protein